MGQPAARDAETASPPTAPYASFKALLRVFQHHGAPAVVDHGALRKRFPPGSVENLLATLRFLDLIDAAGAPKPTLGTLTSALDSEAWPASLSDTLIRAFGPILDAGLDSATPAQLNQRLKATYGLQAEACRRAATFLLAAASEAGLPVSPYLMAPARSKGRLLPVKSEAPADNDPADHDGLAARLIAKFPDFDPAWPDALKEHWFLQFHELIQLVKPEDRPTPL